MAIALAIFIVSVASLQMTTPAVTKNVAVDTPPIVFPGPVEPNDLKKVKPEEPEECKGKTYCLVRPADFPEDEFNEMFKDANIVPQPSLVLDNMLTNRQGDPEETDDCDSDVEYRPLYQVRGKRDDDWSYVVQAPKQNFVQRVRLETCKNTEASCFNALHLTSDIKTSCKQKYNKWEVLVKNDKNDTKTITVELPVCCSCVYKTTSFQNRFGIDKKMTTAKTPAKG
ncbi:PREDICTED: uncharacterized protein LOC106115689 [Papilio xuthus]|uniref:Uncharacterized protein LOC106115689 n=1 Tax=Papilio xuthus TaxID=66420 RepID=A0AAJ6Z396_PAPXU|nr:PREDICTED: uncharacterized protein LOC106115689 [Papilio xuthus]